MKGFPMKPKRARELGLNVGTGKKSPEEVQRRLSQRPTVVPDKAKTTDRRACRDRNLWDI